MNDNVKLDKTNTSLEKTEKPEDVQNKGVIDNRSSDEIDTHMVEIEKELQVAQKEKWEVQDKYNKLRRDEIELQVKIVTVRKQKQDLKIILDKANCMIKEMESEMRIEKSLYWNKRHAGL